MYLKLPNIGHTAPTQLHIGYVCRDYVHNPHTINAYGVQYIDLSPAGGGGRGEEGGT